MNLSSPTDAVIFAESMEALIRGLERLSEESECLGLRVSWIETKSHSFNDLLGMANGSVSVYVESVDLVERFTYLGSDIHVSGDSSCEVSRRIGRASGGHEIQKLCDRVASSTLLEDRRDAVRALKSLSKKYRIEVGTQAMSYLLQILQTDRSDSEIIGYALDTLYNVISNDGEEEEQEESSPKQPDDLGNQFTEIFIKNQDNVTLLLSLLEEFDFHVRWPGVKLLTAMLKNQCPQVQSIILESPQGVSRLMDLLADSREVIRNDGLLLLQQLTKGNAAIQKIVAFENAFERLLDIITEEGNSDGGIVVEDCLLLILNLLKNNSSNQNFFKEGSYIQRMKPWFEVGDDNSGWSAQKVTNLHLMLQLVRVMVSPVNPPGATSSCQKFMYHCGLLQQLCTILMATGVPADILTETINTVSEVIRGSQLNQDYFASVNAPSNPPRPAIVVLLMSMVNERQPFVLRCAVLYCFQCFLYKNQKGQGEIVSTLLPSTIDANSISAGQLLCGGLFSNDSLSNWCAAVALAHALQDNLTQKEQLLRVQLATSLGNPPVSLLQQCTNILSQLTGQIAENLGEDEQLVQGLCALLLGICIFYNDNSLENYTKEKLKQLIEKRIGKEIFIEKLGFINKHELYSRAAQKPQPIFSSPEQMLFDHEFTKLVKELEVVITKAVHKSSEEDKKEEEVKKTLEQHDSIVTRYKELIREQDSQINELKKQVTSLRGDNEQLQSTLAQQLSQIQQHKDQYNVLKLKLGKENQQQHISSDGAQINGIQCEEVSRLHEEMSELRKQHEALQAKLTEKESLIETMKLEGAQPTGSTAENVEPNSDQHKLVAAVGSAEDATGSRIAELEKRLSSMQGETEKLKSEVQSLSNAKAELEQQLNTANSSTAILQNEKSKLQKEVAESKKEQDDLLMLLADQDQKISSLKNKLKDLGEPGGMVAVRLGICIGNRKVAGLNPVNAKSDCTSLGPCNYSVPGGRAVVVGNLGRITTWNGGREKEVVREPKEQRSRKVRSGNWKHGGGSSGSSSFMHRAGGQHGSQRQLEPSTSVRLSLDTQHIHLKFTDDVCALFPQGNSKKTPPERHPDREPWETEKFPNVHQHEPGFGRTNNSSTLANGTGKLTSEKGGPKGPHFSQHPGVFREWEKKMSGPSGMYVSPLYPNYGGYQPIYPTMPRYPSQKPVEYLKIKINASSQPPTYAYEYGIMQQAMTAVGPSNHFRFCEPLKATSSDDDADEQADCQDASELRDLRTLTFHIYLCRHLKNRTTPPRTNQVEIARAVAQGASLPPRLHAAVFNTELKDQEMSPGSPFQLNERGEWTTPELAQSRVQIFKVSHESVEDSSISADEEDGQGLDSSNGDTQEETTGGDNVSDNGESSEPDEDDSHEGQPKAKGCTSDEDNSCPDDSDEYAFEGIGDDSHQSNENSVMNDADPEPPRQW
ncbi:USO1 factor, partial [Polypterus senegalus]